MSSDVDHDARLNGDKGDWRDQGRLDEIQSSPPLSSPQSVPHNRSVAIYNKQVPNGYYP